MVWVIVIIGLVAVTVGLHEWRSRNKPLRPGLKDYWSVNGYKGSGRPLTGGTNFDRERHD